MDAATQTRNTGEWTNVSGYQSALSQLLFPIRISMAKRSDSFRAATAVRNLGSVSMIKAHANAAFEMQAFIPRRHSDDFFVLALQLTGETSYRCATGRIRSPLGTLAFMNRRDVMDLAQLGPADALVLKMPRSLVRRHAADIDDCSWAAADAGSGSGKILRDFLLDLWKYSAGLRGRDHEMLPLTLLTLANCVFHPSKVVIRSENAVHDRLLHRLWEEIAARRHDSSLGAAQLARAMGVSRSTLYEATCHAGTTVGRLIMDMRLDWAARAIADPALAAMSITDLAFEAGFSDLAHFSRRFKRKFGVPPSEYRTARGVGP